MSYDEEIARLKKKVSVLNDALTRVVKTVTEKWRNQIRVNKGVLNALDVMLVRVGKSEVSREEMKKIISEISEDVRRLQEGTIKEIEGFKVSRNKERVK